MFRKFRVQNQEDPAPGIATVLVDHDEGAFLVLQVCLIVTCWARARLAMGGQAISAWVAFTKPMPPK